MFLTLFLILFFGVVFTFLANKFKFPALIGYLIIGICLTYFNLIDSNLISISSELRKIALIIILVKAGLSLNISDLRKVGRPAILMCFLPALIEMIAVGLIAPLFFNISYLHSFLLGSVLAAVSPAVVVPRMVKLIEDGRGIKKGIPQLILAGASMDDIFVIVIYTSLLGLSSGKAIDAFTILNLPISIIFGVLIGSFVGIVLSKVFVKYHMRDSVKVIIIFAMCFGFVAVEEFITEYIGFSSLLASLSLGIVILAKNKILAARLSAKYSKLWIIAEMFLFVLVGSSIQIEYFLNYLMPALALVGICLVFRFSGVFICLIKTKFKFREKIFCMISYTPKATVQAAIGGGLLDLGNKMPNSELKNITIAAGVVILSVSVVAILFTAPIGAYLIDFASNKLIEDDLEINDLNKKTSNNI